jgi:hypothetical protein
MRKPRVPLVIVLGALLGVGTVAARSLGAFQWPGAVALVRSAWSDWPSRGVVSDADPKEPVRDLKGDEVLEKIARMPIRPVDSAGVALRAIQALEARSRTEHENLLEDTQALADESASLVQENTDRVAQLAVLKAEIAALSAEVAALRQVCR